MIIDDTIDPTALLMCSVEVTSDSSGKLQAQISFSGAVFFSIFFPNFLFLENSRADARTETRAADWW